MLEGYPASKTQVEEYNEHIGGLNGIVLLDLKEDSIKEKMTSEEDQKMLARLKHETLPVLHHYDTLHRLNPVSHWTLNIETLP